MEKGIMNIVKKSYLTCQVRIGFNGKGNFLEAEVWAQLLVF